MPFTLWCDDAYYLKAHKVFSSNCDEGKILMNWWQTKMPDIIAKTSSTDPFRVLAVGTSNGARFDEELLNMLCTSQKHVVYTVVEPSESAVKEFQELAKKYSSVEFRWFCMTWQDFQDKEWKKEDGSQYNVIHFVHSAYHISSSAEELKERIKKCYYEMLNGALISVTVDHRKNIGFVLAVSPPDKVWWFRQEFAIFPEIAKEQRWKVDDQELSYNVDLSACLDKDSEEGNLLLDFIAKRQEYRLTAPKEELKSTMERFNELANGGSEIVYPCMLDVTTIWKEVL